MAKKAKKKEKPLSKIEEKRVIIAKDALAQIKAEKYRVESSNGYVVSSDLDKQLEGMRKSCQLFLGKSADKVELREYLDKVIDKAPCEVCAKGALFLSSIRKFNNFSLEEAGYEEALNDNASGEIQEIFGEENADRIEEYFERNDPYVDSQGMCWSDQYDDDTVRLEVILKNVIANRGQFIPEFK